jgi:hypothetical protein
MGFNAHFRTVASTLSMKNHPPRVGSLPVSFVSNNCLRVEKNTVEYNNVYIYILLKTNINDIPQQIQTEKLEFLKEYK